MARCHITGVWLRPEDAYVLDITEAHAALRNLKHQVHEIESLLEQLGQYDEVEKVGRKEGKTFTCVECRLVSPSMADVLAQTCPERNLFIPWAEWRKTSR